MNMSDEDVYLLAGETEESSTERERLETKKGILEKGLQDIKSFNKRRAFVDLGRYEEVALECSEMPGIARSKLETASETSTRVKAASERSSSEDLSELKEQTARIRQLLSGRDRDA